MDDERGFWSVIGEYHNGFRLVTCATRWDVLGTQKDADELMKRALAAGFPGWKNLRLVRQCSEAEYWERMNPVVPEGAFRDVNLPPLPTGDY